jgi:hypothetical protein
MHYRALIPETARKMRPEMLLPEQIKIESIGARREA